MDLTRENITRGCSLDSLELNDCETWSPILRDADRLRVSVYRMLRRIFGPKWNKIIGWRKVYNEDFLN
jgi:hypothetical protein